MFFFAAFSQSGEYKCLRSTNKNFHGYIKQKDVNLVLFSTKKDPTCRRIQSVLDTIVDQYDGEIGCLAVDSDASKEIPAKYQITNIPSLWIFKDQKPWQNYKGLYTPSALKKYVNDMLNPELTYIQTAFDLFRFQNSGPSNIVLASHEAVIKSEQLLSHFAGQINIGVIDNIDLLDLVPAAQFRCPSQGTVINLTDLSFNSIEQLLKQKYRNIEGYEYLGSEPTTYSILALYNEGDVSHEANIREIFNYIEEHLDATVTYEVGDFFKLKQVVDQLGIFKFDRPIYIVIQKQDSIRFKMDVFKRTKAKAVDIFNWIQHIILGTEIPFSPDNIDLPQLFANDFINIALNPKADVILFLADPKMQFYDLCLRKFKMLMTLFEPYRDKVQFFEFDPLTEHVMGLSLPSSPFPQINIWGATETPNGQAFQIATVDMKVILENFLKLIGYKVPNRQQNEMWKKLEQLLIEDQNNSE